jgi:hypothetical protein
MVMVIKRKTNLHDVNLNTTCLKGSVQPMVLDRFPQWSFAWKMCSGKHSTVEKNKTQMSESSHSINRRKLSHLFLPTNEIMTPRPHQLPPQISQKTFTTTDFIS